MRLENKVAIVTGSAAGIGRAVAIEMARQGSAVLVVDLNVDGARAVVAEIEEFGGRAAAKKTDVTQRAGVREMATATLDRFGRIDTLVNNAGARIIRSFLDHSEDDWDQMLNINLKSQFLCAQAVIPAMLEQGRGRIINTASVASHVGRPDRVAYCAAKAGVLGLTRAMAMDLRHHGICVNALAPGSMETPLNQQAAEDPGVDWGAETIVGRWGRPEEVAHAAVFLASDESSYITGSEITVDGGWLAGRARDGEI